MNVPAFDHDCTIILLLLEEGRLLDVGGHGCGEVKFGVWVLRVSGEVAASFKLMPAGAD
jgi:hypothetical protein